MTARPAASLTALACADMFVFGIVMALVGAVVPTLNDRLPLTLGMIGNLFLFMNLAMLVASLLVGLAMDRYGMKGPLSIGAWLVGAALFAIASAATYAVLLAAVVLLGFGGGALNAAANTLVADLRDDETDKAAALNLLGVFFGFGALVLPFGIGALTARLGLAPLLLDAAVLCLATGAAAVLLAFPPPKQRQGFPFANMSRFIGMPAVAAAALLLFFESGNEFMLGGYISTFFTRTRSLPLASASYVLAGYWAALMLARVMLSRVALRIRPPLVVLGGAVMAAAGGLLTAAAGLTPLAILGVIVTGFALAGIFPSVLAIVGNRFREHSGTVFGILFTVALCGGMTVPWFAGHLAERAGLRAVFVLAAANFVAVAMLNVLASRGPAGQPALEARQGVKP